MIDYDEIDHALDRMDTCSAVILAALWLATIAGIIQIIVAS